MQTDRKQACTLFPPHDHPNLIGKLLTELYIKKKFFFFFFTFVNGMHCTKKMYTSFSETLQSIRVLCTATRKSIISASNCRSQKSPVQSISETVNLHSTQYFQVNKTKQQQKMLILLPRLQPNFTHTSTSQAPIQINSKKSQRCSNRDNLSTF